SGARTRQKDRTRVGGAPQSPARFLRRVSPRGRSHQIIHQIGAYSISPFTTSQARNAFLFFHCATDRMEPIVVKTGDWPAKKFFLIETTFGERDRKPAFGAIVRALYKTLAD